MMVERLRPAGIPNDLSNVPNNTRVWQMNIDGDDGMRLSDFLCYNSDVMFDSHQRYRMLEEMHDYHMNANDGISFL